MNDLKVIENDLVPVYETSTGEKVVYGSELHAVLEVKTPYKDWSTRRLNDIDAIENEDFQAAQICAPSGQVKKDHIIKLDAAKEMAMLERNEKGKEVRRYFIRVEKKCKSASLATQELSPQLQVMIQLELEQKRQAEKLEHVENRVDSIREVVAMDSSSWRDETGRLFRKIGSECGDNKSYQDVRTESYQLLEKRMGVQRLYGTLDVWKVPEEEYFRELIRVSKHQIVWGCNYFSWSFPPGRIVWDKCNGNSCFSDCEIAFCSLHNSTRLFRYMWNGMFQGKSIAEGWVQQGNKKLKLSIQPYRNLNGIHWVFPFLMESMALSLLLIL